MTFDDWWAEACVPGEFDAMDQCDQMRWRGLVHSAWDDARAIQRLATPTPLDWGDAGYWCVICQRLLPNDDGVIVHDDVPHPDEMTFDEEERPQ